MSRPGFLDFAFALAAGLIGLACAGCDSPSSPLPPLPGTPLAQVGTVSGLALDSTTLYVTQKAGPLVAIPISGIGQPSSLAAAPAAAVAVDDTRIYWSDGISVLACLKSDCANNTVTLAPGNAQDLEVDASSVYWADAQMPSGGGQIMKVDKNGGSPIELAPVGWAQHIALDAQYVYWAEYGTGGIVRVPVGGGPWTEVASVANATIGELALDDLDVYFTTVDGRLFTAPKTGGTPRVLLTDLGPVAIGVATDGVNLYVPHAADLVRMPVTGGPITRVMSGLQEINAIILDDAFVYVATLFGSVLKTAR